MNSSCRSLSIFVKIRPVPHLPSETSKQTLSADKILTFEALTFDCGVRLQDPNLRAVRHAHAKAVGRWQVADHLALSVSGPTGGGLPSVWRNGWVECQQLFALVLAKHCSECWPISLVLGWPWQRFCNASTVLCCPEMLDYWLHLLHEIQVLWLLCNVIDVGDASCLLWHHLYQFSFAFQGKGSRMKCLC